MYRVSDSYEVHRYIELSSSGAFCFSLMDSTPVGGVPSYVEQYQATQVEVSSPPKLYPCAHCGGGKIPRHAA